MIIKLHLKKFVLFEMLKAKAKADFAINPATSVNDYYFAHPQSQYFNLGKVAKDQVKDYARRKNLTVEDVERLLNMNLNYR